VEDNKRDVKSKQEELLRKKAMLEAEKEKFLMEREIIKNRIMGVKSTQQFHDYLENQYSSTTDDHHPNIQNNNYMSED
jgi:hypothetical protein